MFEQNVKTFTACKWKIARPRQVAIMRAFLIGWWWSALRDELYCMWGGESIIILAKGHQSIESSWLSLCEQASAFSKTDEQMFCVAVLDLFYVLNATIT